MTKLIIKFVKKYRSSKSPGILFLKFIYSVSSEWLLGIFNLIVGAFVPNVWNNEIAIGWKILFFAVLVLANYYYHIIRQYKAKEFKYRLLADNIMDSCTVISNALANFTIKNKDGKGYFEFASNSICSELYECLKEHFKCEFRVSVVQQFPKRNQNSLPYCKMIARRSAHHLQNTTSEEYKIPSKEDTYFYVKLFQNEEASYFCLVNEEEISKKRFFYKRKKHSKIQQYVAVLEEAYSDNIAFILQVDCMEKGKLGKTTDEIEEFAARFFAPYVSILNNAYQHERVLTSI